MSIDAIRRLQATWNNDIGVQGALNSSFDTIGFTEEYVSNQILMFDSGLIPRKIKYIKDNVWGMIEVDSASMRLLDCPILQKLRGIRQLGLSYLTYPSAEHSRFVHSLGMSFVVTEFLRAIDKRIDEEQPLGRRVKSDELTTLGRCDLIHAALLHDVGHMPFSHATEAVFKAYEHDFRCGECKVVDLLDKVENYIRKKISLSETLSILIILSKRFERFYRYVINNEPDALLRIACLIAALPPEPHLSGVTEIISSAAVDADKIDYVTRDAKACGIPVGVDVARVFLRSSFVEVAREDIIRAELKDDPASKEILFVVNASGVDTLDEITQSRAALFQRVYLHPVTRTAEAILGQALRANAESAPDSKLSDALYLWGLNDADLLGQLANSTDPTTSRLGSALRNRHLPKKACVFSTSIAEMHMPLKQIFKWDDPSGADDLRKIIVNTSIEFLTDKELRGPRGELVAKMIKEELKILVDFLQHDEDSIAVIPKAPLVDIVLVGTLYMDGARKDCIVLQNGELLRTKNFTNIGGTQDASELVKAVGFVMSDPQWAPLVLIAARTVLSTPLGPPKPAELPLPRTEPSEGPLKVAVVERMLLNLKGVLRRTGITRRKFDTAMEASTRVGYFDKTPLLARPVDSEGTATTKIAKIAECLSSFEGQRGWQVRPDTVTAFVNQFPVCMRGEILNRLTNIKYLGNQTIVQDLLNLLNKISVGADIVPLSPASGEYARTALHRAFEERGIRSWNIKTNIRDALADSSEEPIVLIDDNIASATQTRAQLLQWASHPIETWPEECRGEDNLFKPLTAEEWIRFQARPIKIITCAGMQLAKDRLLDMTDILKLAHPLELLYSHEIKSDNDWSTELREYLSAVGRSVLKWMRCRDREPTPQDLAFCDAHAFGYNGAGGLLATATNVPTSTVTALWCPGVHNGSPWMPLLIRQNKLRHLVLG